MNASVDRRVRTIKRGLRSAATTVLVACLVMMGMSTVARADGDPGSDVLVYQDLFAGSDAGLSVRQQLELGAELKAAARKGFPIRVAIIASRFDLGAVTALWRDPRAYARFLGIELSAVYRQRLLVVMPDGLGFNWPGHATRSAYGLLAGVPIRAGGDGLFDAASMAVRTLAAAHGIEAPGLGGAADWLRAARGCQRNRRSCAGEWGARSTTWSGSSSWHWRRSPS